MLREYTELIGLIPYELEPMAASPAAKQRLLQTIQGKRAAATIESEVAEVVEVPRSTWGSRAFPLAATIAILLLGIVGWQSYEMTNQDRAIVDLTDHLSQVNIERTAEVAQFEKSMQQMQDQLALVTSKGVEVCTLKPQAAQAAESGARGTLYVASDHQHWYLRIEDLLPCPKGRAYQLWFMMPDGTAVDGGLLEVEHGAKLEVTSDTMPAGAVAVNITLEPAGGSEAPSGPSILYGDEVMRIL